jgi:hypothetical protein
MNTLTNLDSFALLTQFAGEPQSTVLKILNIDIETQMFTAETLDGKNIVTTSLANASTIQDVSKIAQDTQSLKEGDYFFTIDYDAETMEVHGVTKTGEKLTLDVSMLL